MQITLNGVQVFYQRHLGHKQVILLHGWGGSTLSMNGIYEYLCKRGCDVVNLDLPGFGQSQTPPNTFTMEDYAKCVCELIERLNFSDVTLIGHSFGGRIAILLGENERVKNLILTSSAGVKPRFSIKKALKVRKYKRAVRLGKDTSAFGSLDYKALGNDMRKVFVRIVNRHLDEEIKKINVPTLLVWGNHDTQTPLYMGKKIKKWVKDCGLVVLNGSHFVYAEKHHEFCKIVGSFLNLPANNADFCPNSQIPKN